MINKRIKKESCFSCMNYMAVIEERGYCRKKRDIIKYNSIPCKEYDVIIRRNIQVEID